MSAATATIIGSTGLIGSYLLEHLKDDNTYSTIRLLVRRPVQNMHPKVEVKLVDFNDHESFKLAIDGSDVVFCTIGTTQKKVKGNKEAYRKVDYDIAVKAAQFCKETGCKKFILVSSVGANSNSNNFYLQLKGQIEDAVKAVGLKQVALFRPSVLLGQRQEKRPGERIGQVMTQVLSFFMLGSLSKYKPIHAQEVAKAMVAASKQNKAGVEIYEYNQIKQLIS